MLHKFLKWIEGKMRAKGEEFSADHMLELQAMVEGMDQAEAMLRMRVESKRLALMMKEAESGVEHGVFWTQKLNVDQALRGGNGKLIGWSEE